MQIIVERSLGPTFSRTNFQLPQSGLHVFISFAIQMSNELMVACVVSKTPPQHKHSALRKIMCES